MGQHGLPGAGEVGTNRAGDRGSCALRTVVPCCTVVPVRLTNGVLLCGSQQAVVTGQTFTSRRSQTYRYDQTKAISLLSITFLWFNHNMYCIFFSMTEEKNMSERLYAFLIITVVEYSYHNYFLSQSLTFQIQYYSELKIILIWT